MRRELALLMALAALATLAGCGPRNVKDINERLTSLEVVRKQPPNATYIVEPPDSIEIRFLNQPHLNTTEELRQDGIVNLPHVGEIEVARMTCNEIEEKLEKAFARFYRTPEVVVEVAQHRSKFYYLYGEIPQKGAKTYTGYVTLSEAIGKAGGVTSRAATRRVKVIRPDIEEPEIFRANLKALLGKGEARRDVSIAENDVIYVPPTRLAWVGYQIEALLYPFRSVLSAAVTTQTAADLTNGEH